MSKRVSAREVLQFLTAKGYTYQAHFLQEAQVYQVASFFDRIPDGFYFFTGQQLPEDISASLVLMSTPTGSITDTRGNAFICIDADPQLVFYQLMSALYALSANGSIAESSIIGTNVQLGKNVQVDPYVIIEDNCVIGDNSIIRSFTRIYENTVIGNEVEIESQCSIGTTGVAWTWNEDQSQKIVLPQLGSVHIGNGCFIGANSAIVRGSLNEATRIGERVLIAPGARLGHGTQIGSFTHLANNVVTGGNTKIGSYCFIGSGAIFRPKVSITDRVIVGAAALVTKHQTEPDKTLVGVPARVLPTKENPAGMPKPKQV